MKGKKVSSYEFNLENLIGNMPTMMNFYETKGKNPLNFKSKNFIVDTCFTPDTGCWETGISSANFNECEWIIVDEYESKKEAEIGHEKWIKFMKTNPKMLTDIHIDESYKFNKI